MSGTYIGSKATLAASALTTGDGLVVIDVSAADVRIVEWSDFRGLFVGSPGADPNADRLLFWDDSAGAYAYLAPGANLTITGTTLDATGGTSLPVADTTALVMGSSDATKQLRLEVDGFTAGATRTITVPNVSSTMAVLTTNQTFSGTQTFSDIVASALTVTSYLIQGNARITGGAVHFSAEDAVAAAGTAQGTATDLTRQISRVTSASAGVNDGVQLTITGAGANTCADMFVANGSAATLKVYPNDGGQIDALGVDAPYSLAAGACATFYQVAQGAWVSFSAGSAGALLAASNLSDLASASTARTNLGVTATGADTTYAFRANNLSDLASASTARTNLGLGTAATQNTGTSGATVPLLNAGNTFSATQVVEGTLTVRQSGGVAGTDEVQLSMPGIGDCKLDLKDNGGLAFAFAGTNRMYLDPTRFYMRSTGFIGFSSSDSVASPYDVAWSRAAEGVMRLCGASATDPGGLSSPRRTPTTLAGDQNDYSPGVGRFQRWSSDSTRTVTGVVAGADGDTRFVWNVDVNDIVLANESASSAAANRFTTSTGANLNLGPKKCALMMYDGGSSRWRVTLLP